MQTPRFNLDGTGVKGFFLPYQVTYTIDAHQSKAFFSFSLPFIARAIKPEKKIPKFWSLMTLYLLLLSARNIPTLSSRN